MGFTYTHDNLRTKQDYINLLEEIKAYRELDGESFDFGNGLITNEMSYGSEDAYYEMDIQSLEEIIDYWDEDRFIQKKSTNKLKFKVHNVDLKKKEKDKIDRLGKIHWSNVRERDGWKQRCYRGSRSSYLKKLSNKKIRRFRGGLPSKGNTHHKLFDFWWELY